MSENKLEGKYVVRFYDGFDNEWKDVSKPVSREKASEIWNKKTNNGKKNATFDDIDYYSIFPADTVMKFSEVGKEIENETKER
jgi:hypothetical protein